jgi:membrane-associated phospholipid phosphatase
MLDPDETPSLTPRWRQRLTLMAINGVLFQALYSACNISAARAGITRNIATAWDASVPFVPWMLLPYMTSVPLLVMAFLFTPTRQSLRALSQRCMLTTVVGTLIFALWPLHITVVRPPSGNAFLSALGDLLQRLDAPYNQWPSLHVAYCMLVWVALRDRFTTSLVRLALAAWLTLVATSTVLTHQHYLPDFAGGVLLGATALWVVPAQRNLPWVSLHYAVAATA